MDLSNKATMPSLASRYRLIGYHGTAHWLDKFAQHFGNEEEEGETNISQRADQTLD